MIDFTPRARQTLSLARKESEMLHHNYVGTGHLLLGLLKLGQGVAITVLKKNDVDLEAARLEVETHIEANVGEKTVGNIPYNLRIKKVLSLAGKEAKNLNHSFIGTEHLILALLREGEGLAARVLRAMNCNFEGIRKDIMKELDPNNNQDDSDYDADDQIHPPEYRSKLTSKITIDLSGKIAVVTGGGQGLGRATSTVLHEAGAQVAITFFRDAEGANERIANETASEIGDGVIAIEGDVRDRKSIAAMFENVSETFGGPIDIVVNNAAILRDRSIKKMDDADWDAVIGTNLTGVFNVSKEAAERLAPGGRIVNMASISGSVGFFGQANYSAAKAGVVGLTKVLSKELARRAITVNAVAPGVALTEMGKSIPEEARDEMLKQIPLGRFGEPEEVANAILFLCSSLADYVTGQTIHVNGGWLG